MAGMLDDANPFLRGPSVLRRKARGYCAGHCSVCHGIRAFAVTDVFRVPCLGFVPAGAGEIARVEKACTECRNVLVLNAYAVVKTHGSPHGLRTLLNTIPDDVRAEWERRAEEDRLLASDPKSLSGERRAQRLLEAFSGMEEGVARAMSREADVDWGVCAKIGAFSAVVAVLLVHGDAMARWGWVRWLCDAVGTTPGGLAFYALLVTGGAIAVYVTGTQKSRYLKRCVYPRLAHEVALLRPTPAELLAVRDELARRGYAIAEFSIRHLVRATRRFRRGSADSRARSCGAIQLL